MDLYWQRLTRLRSEIATIRRMRKKKFKKEQQIMIDFITRSTSPDVECIQKLQTTKNTIKSYNYHKSRMLRIGRYGARERSFLWGWNPKPLGWHGSDWTYRVGCAIAHLPTVTLQGCFDNRIAILVCCCTPYASPFVTLPTLLWWQHWTLSLVRYGIILPNRESEMYSLQKLKNNITSLKPYMESHQR